jgi:Ca2+:H+ antiporter
MRADVLLRWTTLAPVAAVAALAVTLGRELTTVSVLVNALLLGAAVLAAVHHAEVVAHRVGEPFGSLVLAVAVTIIEVGLILTLMLTSADGGQTLARDTVFAAVMITCNGIVGLSLTSAGLRHGVPSFNAEGSGTALAAVFTVAVMSLVLPTFTTSEPGPEYTPAQLGFAAVVLTQTVRHRDFFLPVDEFGSVVDDDHGQPPTARTTLLSLVLLIVSLVAVVGLAKTESSAIEAGVSAVGLPQSFVGVVIALLVLLPESLAANRNALRNRVQVSLNLAYGSAMASIGLTVPALALATVWIDTPLQLGLGPTHLVLLGLTAVVSVLTVAGGRATRMQGAVHLTILAAFVFLSAVP